MNEYTLQLSAEDIGEIITIIRVQHLKMHTEPFARKIGIKEKLLLTVEEGRGPHGLLVLKKIDSAFHNIKVSINIGIL